MSWLIFALLSAIFAALVAIFGKIGLKEIDSTLATTVRSIIMAGFLFVTSLIGRKISLGAIDKFTSKDWLFIVLSGVAGALSWLFYFMALKQGDASKIVAIDRLSIIFVVVFAALFLGEALSWKSGLGAILILSGAILISLK